jgi:HlyD family secretion protein
MKYLLCLLGLLLEGCSPSVPSGYQGYVEGEWLYLSAPLAGYLENLAVTRGGQAHKNDVAFTLTADQELHGLREAEARARAAKDREQNLAAPRRAQEIGALKAQVSAAEATLRLSTSQLQQQETLAANGYVATATLDAARAAKARDAAQLEALHQQLDSARNALGRAAEVSSANAERQAANELVAQKRWQVEHKTVLLPDDGEITETYYHPGEWVPAGQPVLSLLPADKRRIVFYVPEKIIATLHSGSMLQATCDGCAAPIAATVNFIAAQAEYTPPVIYSQGSREKLVFRIEAVPAQQDAARLRPGLPVEVHLQ